MAYAKDPTKEFLRAVGENIRYYRKKRGLTLEALGDDVGLDKGNMHRIEAGKNITLVTLLKLSVFLEVDPVKLLDAEMNISLEAAEEYIRQKKNKRVRPRGKKRKK
jgi:transcriptional regulator with XRE-family HTH domain